MCEIRAHKDFYKFQHGTQRLMTYCPGVPILGYNDLVWYTGQYSEDIKGKRYPIIKLNKN